MSAWRQLEVVAGAVLLALSCGFAGAKIVLDADWRLAQRRRRARRARVGTVDLTGIRRVKASGLTAMLSKIRERA